MYVYNYLPINISPQGDFPLGTSFQTPTRGDRHTQYHHLQVQWCGLRSRAHSMLKYAVTKTAAHPGRLEAKYRYTYYIIDTCSRWGYRYYICTWYYSSVTAFVNAVAVSYSLKSWRYCLYKLYSVCCIVSHYISFADVLTFNMSHILLFTQEYYTWSTILANNSWVYVLTACMGMRLDSRIMKPVTNFTPHLNFC